MTIYSSSLVRRNPLIVARASSAAPDDLSTKGLTTCANCGARLVSEYGAIPWCERCELGLDVYVARPDASWLERRVGAIAFRIAYRMTVSMFRGLVGRPHRRPGWSWARAIVIVASVALYLLVATMVGVGGWLLLHDFPSPTIVLGVLLVGIAAVLAPRFGRIGASDERLTREEAPALHAFVDRVAAAIGAPAPHAILVGSEFGAHSGSVGMRRQRVLWLGLALFGALPPQQRVALLAHQLGHFVNGDVRRLGLTQPALTTLGKLSGAFAAPTTGMRDPLTGRSPLSLAAMELASLPRASSLAGLSGFVSQVLSAGFSAVHMVASAATLQDSQRAEYFTDQRTAHIAGTAPTAAYLNVLLGGPVTASVIARSARSGETERGWRTELAVLMDRQAARISRLRQLSIRREMSLFASHPPTGLRAQLVEQAEWRDPTLGLTQDESDRIDAELSRRYQRCRRDIATSGV